MRIFGYSVLLLLVFRVLDDGMYRGACYSKSRFHSTLDYLVVFQIYVKLGSSLYTLHMLYLCYTAHNTAQRSGDVHTRS